MFIFVFRFHEKYNLITQFEQFLRSFFDVVVFMPLKKHQLSLVYFRQLFCQYEIEICTTCTYQLEMFIFVFRFHEKYNLITQFEQFLRSFFDVVVFMPVVGT